MIRLAEMLGAEAAPPALGKARIRAGKEGRRHVWATPGGRFRIRLAGAQFAETQALLLAWMLCADEATPDGLTAATAADYARLALLADLFECQLQAPLAALEMGRRVTVTLRFTLAEAAVLAGCYLAYGAGEADSYPLASAVFIELIEVLTNCSS